MVTKSKASRGEIITPKMRLTRAAEVRGQIQVSNLIDRLERHVEGKLDLSPTQVRAAETLLRKVLPDLQTTDLHHHDERSTMTEAQMMEQLKAMLAALPADLRAQVDNVAAGLH